MLENTSWTRSMDMVYLPGLMEECTREDGKMANSMEKESSSPKIRRKRRANGETAQE